MKLNNIEETNPLSSIEFWQQALKGFTAPTPLVVDRASGDLPDQEEGYGKQEIRPSQALTSALQSLTQQHQLTLNTLVQGAWALLLSRYSGEKEVVFGTTRACRRSTAEGAGDMADLFINTLPVRVRVPAEMPLLPWLKELQVQHVVWRAYEHIPLSKIREWSELPGDIPLFDSIVVFEKDDFTTTLELQAGARENREFWLLEQMNCPLAVWTSADAALSLKIIYDKHHFDEATVTRMLGHLKTLLEGMATNPTQHLSRLPFLTEAERHQLLVEWNDTQVDYPKDLCIHELFEAQVERTPNAIAVVFENEQLTYCELNRRANQLAHYLRKRSVGPEVLVGICVERSLEMVVGLLGILKAGGAYVPFDPMYPLERLAFMLADTQAPILLTQHHLLDNLPEYEGQIVCLDADWPTIASESEANPSCNTTADNLAYIIYTSGSTGKPKGVMIEHRALVNFTEAVSVEYAIMPADRVLQFASMSFDASAEEIYPCLTRGATLVLRSKEMLSSTGIFLRSCRDLELTVLDLPTTYWHQLTRELVMADLEFPKSLRLVIIGGEQAQPEPLALWFKHVPQTIQLVNTYGPTEATVVATTCELLTDIIYQKQKQKREQGTASSQYPGTSAPLLESTGVPIGHPIWNVQAYVLNQDLQPVPVGVPGELYLGGLGLARGYLNRAELTTEKFISNPFSNEPKARLYKTGDLARYSPNGNIEFLGRIDHQVKIRGFRVELGEIEAVLGQYLAVQETVVLARVDESGNKRLVAYIVPNQESAPTTGELRNFLKKKLPDYMVPAAFVMLDALPLTPNGKVNRRALPTPDRARPELEDAFVAPRTPVEEVLAGIWAEVLGLDQIGIHDNFFELGGHSLLATQVLSRIRNIFQMDLPLHYLFEASTIADLSKIIEENLHRQPGLQFTPIRPIPRHGHLPLSFSQERVWFIQQLYPSNMAYNTQSILRFKGLLDVAALGRSLSEIVRRHEIFRTSFRAIGDRPVQVIHQVQPVNLPVVDLQALPEHEREAGAQQFISQELQKPFDPTQLPLIRWTLLRLSAQEHILVVVEHHLIHDGWSFNVFLHELMELYKAFSVGKSSPLPELPIQFVDFAHWQRQWLQGEVAETQLAYWREKLAGSPSALQLPFDHPRPAVQTFHGAAPCVELPLTLCESLRAMSRQEGCTLFMTMLAAFVTLLYRYSGQDDICVGTGIANRRWRETEGLIGMIINNITLRTDLSGNLTFRELLGQVREVTLEAYAHQDIPFDKVVEALQRERDLSRNPLFQVMFSFHDSPLSNLEFPGLNLSLTETLSNGSAKFDLNIIVIPRSEQRVGSKPKAGADGITVIWEYNTDLFDEATITHMIEHYQTLLKGIVADPNQHLSDLPLLTEAERHQLLVEWNDTRTDYPRYSTIHQLFEAQVEQTPHAVAVVFHDQYLTYGELNRRANRLAHYLQGLGVGAEICVGLCMERSLEMIVGILAILKAGGAYVPLDPEYPEERLGFMLADTQAPVLLTQQSLLAELPEYTGGVVCLDTDWAIIEPQPEINPSSETTAENLAYVMYTSGSTGKPKGTCITHRNVVRLVKETNYANLTAEEVFLQFAPISFDAATFEIWGPLLNGGRLVVFPARKPSLAELGQVIQRYQVTTLWLTAGLFHQMVENRLDNLRTIRHLLAGGDVLSVPHVRKVLQELEGCTLTNGYGPTENTTFTTCYRMADTNQVGASVSIGRPIANTQVYILDRHLQPVPIGIPGELYIGGDGLARGYLNQPELTAEKFIKDPFSHEPGARLYKTGDLVRYLRDGNIEFLGRRDHQVKIRGFRVEPGEIETILAQHPAVRENVVLGREDTPGEKRLVAYIIPDQEQPPTVSELRAFLREKVPDYMVPSAFITLDMLPLTPNGKVNRHALPAPDITKPELEEIFAAPRTPIEEALAEIWAKVLKLERVGVNDDFFDLGGHSLLATQVISRLRDTFQVEIPLRYIFELPTVAKLAEAIKKAQDDHTELQAPTIVSISRKAHRMKRSTGGTLG